MIIMMVFIADPEIDMKKCEVKVSAPIGGKGVLECQFHVNPAVTRQHVSWHGESTEKDYTTWSMQVTFLLICGSKFETLREPVA